jgi:hypothetical protein
MRLTRKCARKWLPLLLIYIVAGCTVPLKPAIYLAPGFQPPALNEIKLLPALDVRIDKNVEVNVQGKIREAGKKILESKGYRVSLSENIGDVVQIMEDDLKAGDSKWIKRLGPPEARWVMVLVLVDVTTKLTFGSTGNAEVSGFLYNKESGTIAWRDKGIGRAGQGGLIGMAMKGMMAGEAISGAISNLLASIPNRPK